MVELYSREDIIENYLISVDLRKDPKDSPLHTHDFLEIIYITEGNAVHKYKGQNFFIKKGNFFFIDYNSEHQIICKSENFEGITCTFTPEFIDNTLLGCAGLVDVFKNYTINLSPLPLINYYSFNDECGKVLSILKEMINEYQSRKPGYLSFLRSYLIQLLLSAIRKLDTTTMNIDERVVKIIDHLHCHYNEHITLESLCRNYYCSISNISTIFKAQMGITFTEYLRELRIKTSCRFLTDTQKSIEEIANNVGYNDVRTFREHFKMYFNITPLRFRKISQGSNRKQYLLNQ